MNSSNFAATKETLERRLIALGCSQFGETITATIYKTEGGNTFMVPRPLIDGLGYTVGQISYIENLLAAIDLDLLPLEP